MKRIRNTAQIRRETCFVCVQEIFDDWARKVQQRNLGVSGRIFAIENTRSRTGRGNYLKLKVKLSKEFTGYPVLAVLNRRAQFSVLYL